MRWLILVQGLHGEGGSPRVRCASRWTSFVHAEYVLPVRFCTTRMEMQRRSISHMRHLNIHELYCTVQCISISSTNSTAVWCASHHRPSSTPIPRTHIPSRARDRSSHLTTSRSSSGTTRPAIKIGSRSAPRPPSRHALARPTDGRGECLSQA